MTVAYAKRTTPFKLANCMLLLDVRVPDADDIILIFRCQLCNHRVACRESDTHKGRKLLEGINTLNRTLTHLGVNKL